MLLLLLGLAIAGCGNGAEADLSPFREGELITGRVLENSTACQVDAICSLELVLADTTILAIYGMGERPTPTCQSPAEVTNAAFAVERGELVDVVVTACADGLVMERLVRRMATGTVTANQPGISTN